MTQITFATATITNCDYIGRTVSGICAVVLRDGIEVFRSKAHSKRIACKLEVQDWLNGQGA
jgi:hypothetical protein